MMETIRRQLADVYQLASGEAGQLCADQRGMTNTTYIQDDSVITIYANRSAEQAELMAYIARKDCSGLLPQPRMQPGGISAVFNVGDRPSVVWQRVEGQHYVEQDHTRKHVIPVEGHRSVACAFWDLHHTLSLFHGYDEQLGAVVYPANCPGAEINAVYEDLPEYLQVPRVQEFLDPEHHIPLKYQSLIHHDIERQNVLHAPDGKVRAIVDLDSLNQGDLLFEYARCMVNFLLTDPAYSESKADIYIEELLKAGQISDEDIALLPQLARDVMARDLLYYHLYESDPPKTNITALAALYDVAEQRMEIYFAGPRVLTLVYDHMRSDVESEHVPAPRSMF